MTHAPVCIAAMGVISSIGDGLPATIRALRSSRRGLRPLTLFSVPDLPSPVGEADAVDASDPLPRTHQLARMAGDQAMAGSREPPDAIVLGITTGGMSVTEALLERKVGEPGRYAHHAVGSVAEDLAARYGCTGPVLTVSTSCASGATAIAVAAEMVRAGMAKRVLAGGADGLCRFTYFGFKSLQLIDPSGARPLDRDRRGMSLGEGAAMLLLTRDADDAAGLRILGTGLSCDAHHPTAPHPLGEGALSAMEAALRDAELSPGDIDYINLHGTGTPDNDRAEARAVLSLFRKGPPPASSTKGMTGHTLAAAGAIEAVIAAAAIQEEFVPPNGGFETFDPDIGIAPAAAPAPMSIRTAMSSSFGFGGNNAVLIVGRPRKPDPDRSPPPSPPSLTVAGYACVSGAGRTGETLDAFFGSRPCSGLLPEEAMSAALPPRTTRRLKRLPKLVLSLAAEACGSASPSAISIGTGWGAMSETYDFLMRLFETGMQFPSPTDFIGSVHNAPSGQAAMHLRAKGANVTTTGGDYSFEQALLSADLLTRRASGPVLLIGADEAHAALSPLFDASVRLNSALSDGGGAFLLGREPAGSGIGMELVYYRSNRTAGGIDRLVRRLGGAREVTRQYAAVLAGIPAGLRREAEAQLAEFFSLAGFTGPIIDYRRHTGDFATAAAIAAAAAVRIVQTGAVPGPLASGDPVPLEGRGILLLGLGSYITAVRIRRR